MIELGNHHLTVLYEFVDPDTEHLWLPTYKKRGNWTLCAFGLKKNKTKQNQPPGLTKGIKLESGQTSRFRYQFSKNRGQRKQIRWPSDSNQKNSDCENVMGQTAQAL